MKTLPPLCSRSSRWLVLAGLLALSGCSSLRLIDTQVSAASSLADTASLQGARYSFERSPLQTVPAEAMDKLEAVADQALAQAGLQRDDQAAQLRILVSVQVSPYLADNYNRMYGAPYPYMYPFAAWGSGGRADRFGMGIQMGPRFPPSTQYRYELRLLMRDQRSGNLVYETQALHDGPWNDSARIVPALFSAALKDFPNPPSARRRVDIEIPR